MILLDAEIEEGGRRLARSALGKEWGELSENERRGYRTIVSELAAQLECERSPAAVAVFMKWMGEPRPH